MFSNLFSFDGKIGQGEYRLSCLLSMCVYALAARLFLSVTGEPWLNTTAQVGSIFLAIVLCLATSWFFLSAGVQRCHALNKSGINMLIPFFCVVLLFLDNTTPASRSAQAITSNPSQNQASAAQNHFSAKAVNAGTTINNITVWDPDEIIDETVEAQSLEAASGVPAQPSKVCKVTAPTGRTTTTSQNTNIANTGKTGPYQPGRLYD